MGYCSSWHASNAQFAIVIDLTDSHTKRLFHCFQTRVQAAYFAGALPDRKVLVSCANAWLNSHTTHIQPNFGTSVFFHNFQCLLYISARWSWLVKGQNLALRTVAVNK